MWGVLGGSRDLRTEHKVKAGGVGASSLGDGHLVCRWLGRRGHLPGREPLHLPWVAAGRLTEVTRESQPVAVGEAEGAGLRAPPRAQEPAAPCLHPKGPSPHPQFALCRRVIFTAIMWPCFQVRRLEGQR